MSDSSHQSGFTLIETLIVVTLLALLVGLLSGALRYTARAAGEGSAILERSSELTLVANFMRAVLADARPLPRPDDRVDFAGRENSIALIGSPPAHLAAEGFYRMEIALDGDRHRLALHWTPINTDRAITDDKRSTLLDNISGIAFAYFGAAAGEGAPAWHSRWEDQASLPTLVRLRIEFANGAAPDLIVALRDAAPVRR